MKQQRWKNPWIFIIFFAFLYFHPTTAASFAQGTQDDPVVCKSYLENLYAWKEVNLVSGEALSLDTGSQFVVIEGKLTVLGHNSEGFIDLTEGIFLKNDEQIPLAHLIICPSGDGRGIKAASDAVILIKGLKK